MIIFVPVGHALLASWNWLVAQNFLKDVVAWGTGVLMGGLWAQGKIRRHNQKQDQIADLLDDKTPGGIGEVARLLDTNSPGGLGEVARLLLEAAQDKEPEADGEDTDPTHHMGHVAHINIPKR